MGILASVMSGRGLTLADKEDNPMVTAHTKPFKQETYDISLAVILAGYTFEVYAEPADKGNVILVDETRVILTSLEFAERNYSGILALTVRQFTRKNNSGGRETDSDVEINLSILEKGDSKAQIFLKPADKTPSSDEILHSSSMVSSSDLSSKNVNDDNIKPEQSNLFIKDPSTAVLNLSISHNHSFFADHMVGVSAMSVKDLQKKYLTGGASVLGLQIPLFSEKKRASTDDFDSESKEWHESETDPTCGLLVDLQYTYLRNPTEEVLELFIPSSTLSSTLLQWTDLTSTLIYKEKEDDKMINYKLFTGVVDKRYLQQVCCLDNVGSGTQGAIWADTVHKQVVISFRGTQMDQWKDISTNLNMLEATYLKSNATLSKVGVHRGFKDDFMSVRFAILSVLRSLFLDENKGLQNHWNIYITGHSLGGGLATVCAFELGRMREGLWGSSNDDPALTYGKDVAFMTILKEATLTMYSYGAPRCGDKDFKKVYNDVVPNSFRIINSKDLIPTVPKRYYHIGLEVIIDKVSPKKGGFIEDIFTATYDFCSGSNYHQHLTPAYFESISNAVKEYNLLISK